MVCAAYPNSHTNALLNSETGFCDALISGCLNFEFLGSSRRIHPNINLGVSNVNALIGCRSKGSLECTLVRYCAGRGRCRLARKMRLIANTVNSNTVGLNQFDYLFSGRSFFVIVFEVVVVVYK